MENLRTCPICLDEFKDPKLLDCVHTFCRVCIGRCKEEAEVDVGVTCPVCRTTTLCGRKGLDGLPSNYFVVDSRTRRVRLCRFCSSSDHVRRCLVCEETFCLRCRSMHKCVLFVERSNQLESTNDLLLMGHHTTGRTKTVYEAVLLSEFCVDVRNDAKGDLPGWINVIVPINETEAWVVVSNGPYVILYDMLGKEKERHRIGKDLIGGALAPDGRLFLLCLELRAIVFLKNRKWHRFISFKELVCPVEMSIFPDGKVVVATNEDFDPDEDEELDTETDTSSSENELPKEKKPKGSIIVLNQQAQLINRFCKSGGCFRPVAVSSSPIMESFCICDPGEGVVDIILTDGARLGSYHGNSHRYAFMPFLPRFQVEPFKPLCSTVDAEGLFYVADMESKLIHVVSPTGDARGIVATKAPDGFGLPTQIELDAGGKLWVGDGVTGMVKVFRISQYINDFQRPLFDF